MKYIMVKRNESVEFLPSYKSQEYYSDYSHCEIFAPNLKDINTELKEYGFEFEITNLFVRDFCFQNIKITNTKYNFIISESRTVEEYDYSDYSSDSKEIILINNDGDVEKAMKFGIEVIDTEAYNYCMDRISHWKYKELLLNYEKFFIEDIEVDIDSIKEDLDLNSIASIIDERQEEIDSLNSFKNKNNLK